MTQIPSRQPENLVSRAKPFALFDIWRDRTGREVLILPAEDSCLQLVCGCYIEEITDHFDLELAVYDWYLDGSFRQSGEDPMDLIEKVGEFARVGPVTCHQTTSQQ